MSINYNENLNIIINDYKKCIGSYNNCILLCKALKKKEKDIIKNTEEQGRDAKSRRRFEKFLRKTTEKTRKRRRRSGHSSGSSSRKTGSSVFVLRSIATTIVRVSAPSALVATTGKTCRRSGRR